MSVEDWPSQPLLFRPDSPNQGKNRNANSITPPTAATSRPRRARIESISPLPVDARPRTTTISQGGDAQLASSSCPANGPRPVTHAAPQRAPSASASWGERPSARPYVSPAAKQSPAPYVSTAGPG